MTQYRLRSTAERGCHPPAVLAECGAANRIDAPLNPVETSIGDPMFDRRCTKAEIQQLPPSDDPMLPPCQAPSSLTNLTVQNRPHEVVKAPADMDSPPLGRKPA
jgi:hypothetical protein